MTSSTATGRRGGPVVGFLALLWVLGLLALAWWMFTIGMKQWAAQYSDPPTETAALEHQATVALLVTALVAVGGPAIIALVAYRLRRHPLPRRLIDSDCGMWGCPSVRIPPFAASGVDHARRGRIRQYAENDTGGRQNW